MYILICVRTSNEAIGRAAPPQQAGEDRRAHTHKALSLAPRDDGSPLCRRRGLGHEPVEIAAVDALDREHEDRGRGVGCISELTRIKSTCWAAKRRCTYNPTSAAYFFRARSLLVKRRPISLAIASRANSARDCLPRTASIAARDAPTCRCRIDGPGLAITQVAGRVMANCQRSGFARGSMHPNLRYLKYKIAEPDQVQACHKSLSLPAHRSMGTRLVRG